MLLHLLASVIACLWLSQAAKIADHSFRNDYRYMPETNMYYKEHRTAMNWSDAISTCKAEGGQLATPFTINDALVITLLTTCKTICSWIGIHYSDALGTFTTHNGTLSTDSYIKWQPGKPEIAGGHQVCVCMNKDGTYNDVPCDWINPFICTKRPHEVEQNHKVHAATLDEFPRQPFAGGSLLDFINEVNNATLSGGSKFRRQATINCRNTEWMCRDGFCISFDVLCDGIADCPDKSDETYAVCGGRRCPTHLFQCSYGACVDGDSECNNVQDCADNSDEQNKNCDKKRTVVNSCQKGSWQCGDGQCIDENDVCDGKADCSDRSDETVAQCSTTNCRSFLVRCAYGACVDGDAECNNAVECADGSDEDPQKCDGRPGWINRVTTAAPTTRSDATFTSRPITWPVTQPTIPSTPTGSGDGCALPNFPYDGSYNVPNYDKRIVPGDVVSQFIILTYTCKKNFDLTDELSVCLQTNTWSTSPECNRRCTTPTSYTVDFKCYTSAGQVPCSPTLPSGATIYSACKDAHISFDDLLVLTCRGGSWNNTTPKCEPDCGLEKAFGVSHIWNAPTVKKDTFPWHVGVYQDMGNPVPDQICGGSLVRAHVVISAAHCFYDPNAFKNIDARFYKVVCGKFYRSWDSKVDDRLPYVQKSEVKELLIHEYYRGDEQNQQNDVAILVLATPFKLSDNVRPVCIDMNSEELNRIQVAPGKHGKVAGWGTTENGRSSEELKSLEVPVIEFNECRLEMTKYRFEKYLTRDKLCAGYCNGSALCRGDSGGGLVFSSKDVIEKIRWYLRGVVSNGPLNEAKTTCRENTYTAFTEIFKLREWLRPQLRRLS